MIFFNFDFMETLKQDFTSAQKVIIVCPSASPELTEVKQDLSK